MYAAPAGGGLPPRGRWIAAGETDEGKVREQSGRLIPTCPVRQVPGRCGHRPLREGRDFSLNRARPDVLGVPSTPGPAGPPSPSRRGQGFFPRKAQRAGGHAPHPSGPLALPPSPEGKAASGGGITVYLLCCLSGISPGDSSTGCYTAVERGCGEGPIHKNTPQLFYKLWRNFLGFPGGSGGRAGERGG